MNTLDDRISPAQIEAAAALLCGANTTAVSFDERSAPDLHHPAR